MTWADAARLAGRSLGRRRGRSLLAALGVALGTTLLVALLTISSTADSRIVSQLSKGGPAAAIHVDDSYADPAGYNSDTLQTAGHHDLTVADANRIRHAASVASVVPVLTMPARVIPCPGVVPGQAKPPPGCRQHVEDFFDSLVGADLSHASELPITVLAGRLPRPGSMTEVAVSQAYVERLKLDPNRPAPVLGTQIEFATPQLEPAQPGKQERFLGRWYLARIVGVVAQSADSGNFLVPIQQTQAAQRWAAAGVSSRDFFVPRSEAYTALVVVADNLVDVHAVRQEIFAIGFANSAPEHLVASVQKYLHIVDIVLGGIGAVALAIAVLGVANTLLAAVRERWREIGVLKALGAADTDIARWFLFEAGLLGLAGGLVGTLAGIAITVVVALEVNAYLVQQGLQGVDLGGLPVPTIVGAPLATVALAVVAGLAPAARAARLPVREALGG